MSNENFSDFEVVGPNGLSVIWEYIGEGRDGDYNPEDPDDYPHLRANLQYNGETLDSGSYCTFASTTTPKDKLYESAQYLMASVSVSEEGTSFNRRVMETWTWVHYPLNDSDAGDDGKGGQGD